MADITEVKPEKSDITEKKHRGAPKEYLFKPGVSGNPAGRPKGSLSIKAEIIKRLNENPEELKDIVEYFVKEKRDLMWQMIEGRPAQQVDVGNAGELPFIINIVKDEPKREDNQAIPPAV